ncbi:MAG: hypothetical protein ACP6IS_09990 [Candidatus Asgardarchaeia archaeon]
MRTKKIFIIVGNKGGGGKTPISLAFGMTLYRKLDRSVTFIDLGFVNPDLRRICFNMLSSSNIDSYLLKEIVYEVGNSKRKLLVYNLAHSSLFMVTRNDQFLYAPLNYTEIKSILNLVTTELNTEYFIVDTNYSILNFDGRFPLLSNCNSSKRLFFVNLWNLTLTNRELNEIFLPRIMNIKRINNLQSNNFIHVFTPRYITGEKGTLRLLMKLFQIDTTAGENFYYLKKLINAISKSKSKKAGYVGIEEILRIIREVHHSLISHVNGAIPLGGRMIVNYLFDILANRFQSWDFYPANLLVNPLVKESLAYFSELFSNTHISVDQLDAFLNDDVPMIKEFIEFSVTQRIF